MTRAEASDQMWSVCDRIHEDVRRTGLPAGDNEAEVAAMLYALISRDSTGERGDWFEDALPIVQRIMHDRAQAWIDLILKELTHEPVR